MLDRLLVQGSANLATKGLKALARNVKLMLETTMMTFCSTKMKLFSTKTTLVVCPSSVLTTWIAQLEQHTRPGSLQVYLYHGDRTKDMEVLLRHDIILTTYKTLSLEFSSPASPLKEIEWLRVILDEAHVIKNFASQQTKAVIDLKAKWRWVVTGTPIQNTSFDLFSLMAFLKFQPFSIKNYWQSIVQRPLDQGSPSGISRLQICNNVALFPPDLKSLLLVNSIEDVSMNPELLKKLALMLEDGDDFDCPVCLSPPTKTIITCCAHIFCQPCILKTLKTLNPRCPICRHSLSKSDLFLAPPTKVPDENPIADVSRIPISSKVSALLNLLLASKKQRASTKSIVFSQFRKMLILLEAPLRAAGLGVLRLDGSMSMKKRTQVIRTWLE
ncbi:hypothetical protein HPP92_001116 [Vanilla planifolia]|uniref:Uncharacterized protein n=1 Tax=Vanilla planifolia TaxID=51239 RepID=A0A835RXK6_VANPL|nr:hypothetical protein HPP92_001116 [Vanilla planifolia]